LRKSESKPKGQRREIKALISGSELTRTTKDAIDAEKQRKIALKRNKEANEDWLKLKP
jgi:hypothetical protein